MDQIMANTKAFSTASAASELRICAVRVPSSMNNSVCTKFMSCRDTIGDTVFLHLCKKMDEK